MLLAWDFMMKPSIIAVMLLVSTTPASFAQELPIEERACINGAVAKMPEALKIQGSLPQGLKIEGSRVVERRVVEQPTSPTKRRQNAWPVYRLKVEIDVSVTGQISTYIFNCIQSGQVIVVQPLGMR
jgi:hypothetical protein